MKSKQKTLNGLFLLLDKFNAEHKTHIGFLDLLDELSAEAWLKWAENEEKKRTGLPGRKVRKEAKMMRETSPLLRPKLAI